MIDIPLDEPNQTASNRMTKESRLFQCPSNVKTPDEVLAESSGGTAAEEGAQGYTA